MGSPDRTRESCLTSLEFCCRTTMLTWSASCKASAPDASSLPGQQEFLVRWPQGEASHLSDQATKWIRSGIAVLSPPGGLSHVTHQSSWMANMRELFSLTACLLTTVLITVAPARAQGTPAVLDLDAEIPFVLSPRGHILVDVALNGREPVPFALDTGAGRTVINQARLIDLGLEHRSSTQIVQGAHDRSAMGFTDVNSLTVGGMALGAFELATMDLTHVESEDMPLFGVLGFDILSRFDLMLDFVNNTFSLYSQADSPDDCSVCQGPISVPFELAEGTHIRLELSISGQAIAAVLDTGSGRTGMNPLGARALGIELPATMPDRHGPALQIGEITLGGKALARNVIVGVVDLPAFKTLGLGNQPALLLGTGTLAGRRVGISYGLRRLSVT